MKKRLMELKKLFQNHGMRWERWRGLVTVMAMVVVFVTTYALILPAITLEKDQGKPEQGVYLDPMERGSTAALNNEEKPGQTDESASQETDNQADQAKDTGETAFSGGNQDDRSDPEGKEADDGTDRGQKTAYAQGVYTGNGDGLTVSMDLKEEMGLPADVKVSVEEIRQNEVSMDTEADYDTCLAAAKKAAAKEGLGKITAVRFFKFALLSGDKEVRTDQDIDILIKPLEKDLVRNGEQAHVLAFRGSSASMVEDVKTQMSGYRVSAYRFFYPSIAGNSSWGLLGLAVIDPEAREEESDTASTEAEASTESEAATEAAASTEETAASTEPAATTETAAPTEETAASTEETAASEAVEETESASTETVEDGLRPAGTLEYNGEGYRVVMTYDEKAGVPEGAVLQVTEIGQDNKDYEKYLKEAGEALELDEKANPTARFFDIKIMDGDKEFEPASPVSVQIIYDQPMEVNEGDKVDALHFGEKKTEVIEDVNVKTNRRDDIEGVAFEADSFSVYGIVTYTVDFHWEVNGKEYEFSIPGGGFVSLEHLVEVLGIGASDTNADSDDKNGSETAENDADKAAHNAEEAKETSDKYEEAIRLNELEVSEDTKKFVADVESVEFSSPELVWVGKVNETAAVGELKKANGLKVEYSSDLTKEQIAKINVQTVEAEDWALVSVHPFTSEENLTVTMKNGDQFTVRVTDAQISTHVISADGKDYIITVTYGPEARIPEGSTLKAEEILNGTEEYESYLNLAQKTLKNTNETGDIKFARFFDIHILHDEKPIEPAASVKVEIAYIGNNENISDDLMEVVHFADSGTEVISAATLYQDNMTSVSFVQDSFSVTGTVVTDVSTIENGDYMVVYYDGNKSYALTNDGGKVEVVYDPAKNTVKYDGEENLAWDVENHDSHWDDHYYFRSQKNNQYYIGLSDKSNDILRQYWGSVVLKPTTGGKYTMMGDSESSGSGKYLGWSNNSFASVTSNPIGVFIVKVEPIDDIDTSDPKVDERVHYIVTDHYAGGETSIRANGYLTSGQSVPFGSNPSSQEYAGVTVTAGHNAVTIGNSGNITINHDTNVHLVHVDYYYKEIRPTSQLAVFNENDKYDTKTIGGEKYYELGEERVHTEKTASVAEGGDGRSFNLTLEAWNVDWNIATVGMVLDASGSMAWDGAPGHYMQVNSDNKYQPYKFLSQSEVNKILYTDYSDYSVSGYGDYTYYVYEDGKSVNEYAPLGYYGGANHSGNYLTMDGKSATRYATQNNIPQGRAGWYYVNTGNANAFNTIGGSKEYNGINQNDNRLSTLTVHTKNGDKQVTFYRASVNGSSVYQNDIKEWFVDSDTTGMYRKTNTYGPTQGTPSQFYVDDDGYLHCFFYHSNAVFESYVLAKQDSEPIKTEMLQDAIGSFTSALDSIAPDSAVGMTRFSRSNTTNNNGFNDNQLTLLNWTTDSETIISALNMAYGGEYKANSSKTDKGYENAGSLTVYDYGLTSNTSTQSGLTSFNKYLANDNNGALIKWAQDNAKPVGNGYEYDKYVIVFTDGKDTDRNNSHSMDAQNAADELKDKGFSVITVLLAPDSAFNNGSLNQEFTEAKNFLDTLNGPCTGGSGLDWTNTTYIATAADKSALTTVFLDIANKIAKTLTDMTVRDYIDPRFQLVDEEDHPISVGAHPELGFTLGYDSERDMQYVEWTGQDIPTNKVMDNTIVGDNGEAVDISLWSKTIRVRAKDDFLGGNEILSNGNVEELNKVYPDGQPDSTDPKTSRSFPRTTVDPEVLKLELGETEDTIFLGERIDAAEHSRLESEIGDTVDSSWYYEYLERYGAVTNQDYISQIQQGNPVTVPYYYFPADTTETEFNAASLNPANQHAYMKDQIGTLTYEWVPCDADGNEIAITDPYNHLTTNTDDVHYRLKIKYSPKTESEHTAEVNNMTDPDDHGRPVKPPAGTEQTEKESAKDDGIATIHVVSGQLTVSKRVKKEDILKYLARHDEATFTFNLTKTGTPASEYSAIGTDYTDGYGGYTYPTRLSVTVTAAAVNAAEEDDGYVTITGTTVEKLPVGTYEITENTPDDSSFALEEIGYLAVDANYRAYVENDSTKVTFEIGRLAADASVTDPIIESKPELNAQRVSVYARNSVTPSIPVSIKKVDIGNTSSLLGNAVFSLYDSEAVDNSGKLKEDATAIKTGITTDADDDLGFADLDELDIGTYYLVETSAPAGYVLPEYDYIKITVDSGEIKYQTGNTGEPKTAALITRNEQEVYLLEIYNSAGVELPSTGGPGTTILCFLGIMLIGFAGVGLVMRRRNQAA